MVKQRLKAFHDPAKFAQLGSSRTGWVCLAQRLLPSHRPSILLRPPPYGAEKEVLPEIWSHYSFWHLGSSQENWVLLPTLRILSLGLRFLICKMGGLFCSSPGSYQQCHDLICDSSSPCPPQGWSEDPRNMPFTHWSAVCHV